MHICVITFGPEYNGGMFLYHNAELGANRFEECIKSLISRANEKVKITATYKRIRGKQCTSINICSELSNIESNYDKIIIYYSGHGNHVNGKEFWQTSCGNVDQIKMAQLINNMKPPVIVFSDCCSSEHNVNEKVISHPYVSFGATLDYQDAMMMYDGGLFTSVLIDILNKVEFDIKISKLFELISNQDITVETFSVRFSSHEIFESAFIC